MQLGQPGGSSSIGQVLGREAVKNASVAAKKFAPKKPVVKSLGTAQKAKVKPRSNISSGSSSSSGGGGSSGGGTGLTGGLGRSGGTGRSGGVGPPSIDSYLGTDAAYQQSVSGGKRSLADFLSELGRRRGEAGTQFDQTTASMERDRGTQLDDLRNEFASRGLIQSGLYGQEQGRFQQQFTEQQTALQQQQSALLADLLGQETNYRRENDLQQQAAKQEALLRRAQKFNIGA